MRIPQWLRAKDAGLSATRRAGRTAIVMPLAFAFAYLVPDNPVIATGGPRQSAVPDEDSRRDAAAARRLDDAFRTYLAERDSKRLPLADVAALVTGVTVLRITGVGGSGQSTGSEPEGQ